MITGRSEKDLKQDLRTLGLEPGASLDDVERAYRELSDDEEQLRLLLPLVHP